MQQHLEHLAALAATPDDYAIHQGLADAVREMPDRLSWLDRAAAASGQSQACYLAFADSWARAGMGNRRRDPAIAQTGILILQRGLRDGRPGPLAPRLHSNLAFLYNELGLYLLGEHHARLASGSENAVWHLWLAEALFGQGRFASDPLCVVDLAPLATPRIQAIADAVVPRYEQRSDAGSPRPTTILISADAVYFRKFVVGQLLSAHRLGSKVRFHVRIVNPEPQTTGIVARLQAVPGLAVDVSFETCPAQDAATARVHYCCSRFLIAGEIMEATGGDVIIADADNVFRKTPEAILAECDPAADVALVEYVGDPICNRYSASFVLVRRTLLGGLFLALLRDFLDQNFRRAHLWTIDQLALYMCAERLRITTQGAFRLQSLPETVLSIHHLDEAAIWPGATISKWRDSPYTRAVQAVLQTYGFPVEP